MSKPEKNLEIELKFALPAGDLGELEGWVQRLPLFSRRKPTRLKLFNIYYDTPEHLLRSKKMALRLRQIGSPDQPKWVQTLKTSNHPESALSQRGEWEFAVPGNQLDLGTLLESTPWGEFDSDGVVFRALKPCFSTAFERTLWTLKHKDGSCVEVALDWGRVNVDGKSAPICELELELRAGCAESLYQTALGIAQAVPLLPLNVSKAERGYRLIQDTLMAPVLARSLMLSKDMPLLELARQVLHEMFWQFCSNLNQIRVSDAPEILHQARVGWRRFRSGVKFFGQQLALTGTPNLLAMRPLMNAMARMRDLDVAAYETLPMFSASYIAGNLERQADWEGLEKALNLQMREQRQALLAELQNPKLGLCLLALTHWLEVPWPVDERQLRGSASKLSVSDWAKRRVIKLVDRLKAHPSETDDFAAQHQLRITAKRLRYSVEAVRALLPKQRVKHWYQMATRLQAQLGSQRDLLQAVNIISALPIADEIKAFMRGVCCAQMMKKPI